jgi:hypothetical protein
VSPSSSAAGGGIPRWSWLPLLVALVAGLWLAADGRLTSDEPGYLYAAEYRSAGEILAGDVQPSGIPGFLQGRVLHVLFLKGITAVTGGGEAGFRVLQGVHLAILVLNLWLIGRIARSLLPHVAAARLTAAVLWLTPVAPYFALKTLPDNEALLGGLLTTLALLRLAERGSLAWIAVAIVALAAAALTKNQMTFMPAAFWLAFCLVPVARIDRRRLAVLGAACGAGGVLLTIALLEATGIGLSGYLESYRAPFANQSPPLAKLMNLGTELGGLWLLVPAALQSARRRETAAYGLWFVLTMAPFLFFSGVEPRQVAVNLAAAGGLFALGLEAIAARCGRWQALSSAGRSTVATATVVALAFANALMLSIMPHKVDLPRLREALAGLDARYGAGGYRLLAPNGYTDFNIVRVLWPDRDVRDLNTAVYWTRQTGSARDLLVDEWLDGRVVRSVEALRDGRRPLVYFGYRETFAAANLRALLARASPALPERVLGGVSLKQHLYRPEAEWLWGSAELELVPVLDAGNYTALEVRLLRPAG